MVLGGFAGTWLAASAAESGWTRAAWVPSVILACIATMFLCGARDKSTSPEQAAEAGQLKVNRPLVLIAAMYFCVKLARYAFLFWLPLYMTEALGYAKPQAGYASSIFELAGVAGALGAGYVSERIGGTRFSVGSLMMFGLALLCGTYPFVSAIGLGANLLWIGMIGIFTFGPDTLMAAAAIQDVVPREQTAAAGGFVNGIGSLGQVMSPYAVAYLSSHHGWGALFSLLAVLSLAGGSALAVQWIRFPLKQEVVP